MKLSLLSAAFAAALLLSGQASALMIFGGNACNPLGGSADLDYYRLDGGFYVLGANNAFSYLSCPMANMTNQLNGLESGWIRFRVTNNQSSCSMRSMTAWGSVVSGSAVTLTTLNSDHSLNIGANVTSSNSNGFFTLGCTLSGGSRLYSYRYEEAP
ncbi:MAG TPA: hypothetical protein VFQ35_25170 [Polyangiaceae bacterium]|nr:hypothetical protein [Polyangiaceae bacterium]